MLPSPTVEQRIATGYNRVLQTSHEGGVQPKEYMAIYAADHVRNLSIVWMGATLGCCQCHDHKFDPYTTRDFYSMEAFFADIDENRHLGHGVDGLPTPRLPEMELLTPAQQVELAALEGRRQSAEQKLKDAQAAKDETAGTAANKELKESQEKIDAYHKQTTWAMVTEAIEPRPIRILPRGNWLDDSGEIVQPAIPAFLGKLDVGARRATRLDLANWLLDAEHGVGGQTARVMANRLWYLAFGRGVSASLDDFGGQGQPPDNPALLDALAMEFVDSGWDMKHMMKLLAMSRAYRQSSRETPEMRESDPLNKLVARQASYRFPAENVRDAALSISGLLVARVGGASARPYQPAGLLPAPKFPRAGVCSGQGRQPMAAGRVHALAAAIRAPDAQGVRRAVARGMHGRAAAVEHGAGGAGAVERPGVR